MNTKKAVTVNLQNINFGTFGERFHWKQPWNQQITKEQRHRTNGADQQDLFWQRALQIRHKSDFSISVVHLPSLVYHYILTCK